MYTFYYCIFLLITNSLDSYTTHLNVKLRGIDAESNAFARALMKKYGLSVVTAYKTIVGLFLGAAAFVMPNAILGIGIVFLWISIHNYVQFLKAKKDLVVDQVVH